MSTFQGADASRYYRLQRKAGGCAVVRSMGYHELTLLRFLTLALPLLVLLLAVFGFLVGVLDLEPRHGAVIRLGLMEQPRISGVVVLTAWLMEACGLLALFLLALGRCGAWWLDGLVAGSLGWVFRGPIFVLTVVHATRQAQDPWWRLAFAWWILYAMCGLALGWLARRQGLAGRSGPTGEDRWPAEAAG